MPISSLFERPLRTTWNATGNLTETLWWPGLREKTNDPKGTLVLFIIPGNPGVIEYYKEFCDNIFRERKGKIEIVGGHSYGDHYQGNSRLYSLQDQINHKIAIFDELERKFTSEHGHNVAPRFILCGHSIGAYIATQLLRSRPDHGIIQVYALFPTLQHIHKTPNGRLLSPLFHPTNTTLASSLIASLRFILAPHILTLLVKLVTSQSVAYAKITTQKLLHGHVVKNTLHMAMTEMQEVQELDEELIKENLEKFVFYFGERDDWAPVEHYEILCKKFPNGKVLICEDGCPHAFVLTHSEIMAAKVSQWIEAHEATT
ncbi:5138_t:CDS:2 [Paraglomus brasilianum]|uniref:5138_t:CDS:1 n=1 Tax=Paraglomus brasilianum TaxID=144538 RepID=A0A9N8VSK2_9GLOM|nr:5138_t:CDS:2 [Paraglomus brasilianum]